MNHYIHTITSRQAHRATLHSYRATLIPAGANPEEIEDLADARLLPEIRVKARNATEAEAYAFMAAGKPVLRVDRVEA